ncbi:MAG: tRNA epoxyqueuosine(34) reductase QueG [Bacteroidales bacterium]
MDSEKKQNLTSKIKENARELGFDACGIARVDTVDADHQSRFNRWTEKGMHYKMDYMKNHFDKRMNPELLVEGAKSIICLAMNYHQENFQPPDAFYKVSSYAAGKDYHFVIKEKLYELLQFIKKQTEINNARVFTDSAPVMERYWAQKAGLGWIGKNSCLIIPRKGSFYFLAEIILDTELQEDDPIKKNYCGTCHQCMDACPTHAITEPGVIDSRKCISCLTIETKDPINKDLRQKTQGYIFGCDICQQVCPHNKRFARKTNQPAFQPTHAIASWQKQDWEKMNAQDYKQFFVKPKTALHRIKFDKLKDNMNAARDKNT